VFYRIHNVASLGFTDYCTSLALSAKAFSVRVLLSGTHCRVAVDPPNFSALLSVA